MASQKLRTIRNRLFREGRPLDVARWSFHFEDGSAKEVLKALKVYQNSDGGFAHGLEPDLLTQDSGSINTWMATRILREIKIPDLADKLIADLCNYLKASYVENLGWPAIEPDFVEEDLAPWWRSKGEAEFWGYNPSVELSAFLSLVLDPADDFYLVNEAFLSQALAAFMEREPDMHELSNFAACGDMLPRHRLPEDYLEKVVADLMELLKSGEDYSATPATILTSRQSPYYPAMAAEAEAYRDALEASVLADGSWPIPWRWGQAEPPLDNQRRWKSAMTLTNMLYLQGFRQF